MSDHSRFVLQLVDKLGDGLHLDAGLALGRLLDLEHLQPRRDVDAQRIRRQDLDWLLLGLHDVGQRRIARLVQAQVGGDHRRQLDLDVLEAAVDLASDERVRTVAQTMIKGQSFEIQAMTSMQQRLGCSG